MTGRFHWSLTTENRPLTLHGKGPNGHPARDLSGTETGMFTGKLTFLVTTRVSTRNKSINGIF